MTGPPINIRKLPDAKAAVRDALYRAGRPLSNYKLCLNTGLSNDFIARALDELTEEGTVLIDLGPKGVPYFQMASQAKSARSCGSGQIAGRIVHGRGSKWGAGLV